MLINERRHAIIELLHNNKFVTVAGLCKKLYTSPATIRRDLAQMEAQGMLHRLHGGAELIEGSNSDMPLLLRIKKEKGKKETIAHLAVPYIKCASTIFMDSSSTVYYLAKHFGDCGGKTIITNGVAAINCLNEQTQAAVYCTGGRISHQSAFVGYRAIETVKCCCADIMFFSCCGFSTENGSTEAEEENAAVKRSMCENAKRKILLCDSTKFGRDYFCRACRTQDIDLVITDKDPGKKARLALEGKILFP